MPAALAALMNVPVEWLCNARIVAGHAGYLQMGLLNVAYQWRTILMFVPSVLSSVCLPVFSRNIQTDSPAMERYHHFNALVVIGIGTGICLFAPQILALYGRSFSGSEGIVILRLVVLAMVVSGVGNPAAVVLAAKNRMWQGFAQNAVYAGILLAGVVPYGPAYGAKAMGMALLAGYGIQTLICYASIADVMPRSAVRRTVLVTFASWGAGILLILASGCL
jgi:O-antigen/teichoic acid export membrane protein